MADSVRALLYSLLTLVFNTLNHKFAFVFALSKSFLLFYLLKQYCKMSIFFGQRNLVCNRNQKNEALAMDTFCIPSGLHKGR